MDQFLTLEMQAAPVIDISAGGPIRDFPAELTATCIYADKGNGRDLKFYLQIPGESHVVHVGFQVPAGSHSPRRLLMSRRTWLCSITE